jgi:hypothetical protein
MTESNSLLDHIENGDVHDNLLGYMRDGETAEEALERLLFSLPSFARLECQECGRDLELQDDSWVAWRLPVAHADYRRTDLYCSITCVMDVKNKAGEAITLNQLAEEYRSRLEWIEERTDNDLRTEGEK